MIVPPCGASRSTEAWRRTVSAAGAPVSAGAVRSYRCGLTALLAAGRAQDLLRPDPAAATLYLRQLERRGLAPTSIQARIAAGRGLYAGLRWCRAVSADPFAQCHVPHDPTPAWDKRRPRRPYRDDEGAALLQAARDPRDAVLVLLGAHAGRRAQEGTNVHGADGPLARRDLLVRHGQGGKQRVVALSATLRQALQALQAVERQPDG